MRKNTGLAIAILGLLLIACYAPWVSPNGYDFSHPVLIGRAPLWSRQFRYREGAKVEWGEEGLYAVLILGLAASVFFRKR
jgi:hypothetical protein